MKNKAPEENFIDLAADLAIIAADILEHDDCPSGLRDGLNEITNELIDILSPSNSLLLRAVASMAKSGDSRVRTEGEKSILDAQDAILLRSEQESEALAASVQ